MSGRSSQPLLGRRAEEGTPAWRELDLLIAQVPRSPEASHPRRHPLLLTSGPAFLFPQASARREEASSLEERAVLC